MEKEYILPNRYNECNKLVQMDNGHYRLETEFGYRIIYNGNVLISNDDGSIEAVDPSGGPYMTRGYRVAPDVEIADFLGIKEAEIVLKKVTN